MTGLNQLDPTLSLLQKHNAVRTDVENVTDEHGHDPRPSEGLGYLFMFIGAFAFAVHTVLIRIAESSYKVPLLSIIYIRGLIHTLCSIFYFILSFAPAELVTWTLTQKQTVLLLLRGLSSAVGIMVFYTGINMVQVGDAISIYFLNPMFTFTLAALFLSEKVTLQGVISIVLSAIGTMLVALGQNSGAKDTLGLTTRLIGLIMIILGAFMGAVAYTIIRGLGMSTNFMLSILSYGSFCFVGAVFLNEFKVFPLDQLSALQRGGLVAAVAAGLISFIAQCGLSLGLQRCKAGPGVLITNVEVPIVFTLGALFLHEYPDVMTICGSSFIVSAAIVIGFGKISR